MKKTDDVRIAEFDIVDVSSLKPSPYNPRKKLTSIDVEYNEIKESLKNFGMAECIVINKRTGWVVGGEQRINVMKELRVDKCPAMIVDLDEGDEKELNLALNEVKGRYNPAKLKGILDSIMEKKKKMPIGFDTKKFEDMMKQLGYSDKSDDTRKKMRAVEEESEFGTRDDKLVLTFRLRKNDRDLVVKALRKVKNDYELFDLNEALEKITEQGRK